MSKVKALSILISDALSIAAVASHIPPYLSTQLRVRPAAVVGARYPRRRLLEPPAEQHEVARDHGVHDDDEDDGHHQGDDGVHQGDDAHHPLVLVHEGARLVTLLEMKVELQKSKLNGTFRDFM